MNGQETAAADDDEESIIESLLLLRPFNCDLIAGISTKYDDEMELHSAPGRENLDF